jgi:hypothetical protein
LPRMRNNFSGTILNLPTHIATSHQTLSTQTTTKEQP